MIAKSYGYVYVAQVAMGSNPAQLLKALTEAEAYHGPSLIIAYAPCINHGINMTKSQLEEKAAVDCGYWQLYRYNPDGEVFTLDSKEPTASYQDFLVSETRYASLVKTQGEEVAKELFAKTEEYAKQRLEGYKKLAASQPAAAPAPAAKAEAKPAAKKTATKTTAKKAAAPKAAKPKAEKKPAAKKATTTKKK